MRILVAEDERVLADLLADGLRRHAMAVDVAYDGAAALARLAVNDYDVLVLDRDLPTVHGDQVAPSVTGSQASASAPTTTCPSRSPTPNCSPGSRRSAAAATRRCRPPSSGPESRWTRHGDRPFGTGGTCRCPERSTRCSRC